MVETEAKLDARAIYDSLSDMLESNPSRLARIEQIAGTRFGSGLRFAIENNPHLLLID